VAAFAAFTVGATLHPAIVDQLLSADMKSSKLMIALTCLLTLTPTSGLAAAPHLLKLGSEQLIQAGGVDIDVPGYSVPSFVDWNADGLGDLVIGQGGGAQGHDVDPFATIGQSFTVPL